MQAAEQNTFSVILASSSPQRRQVLNELRIAYRFVDPQVSEVALPDAAETVSTNAKLKVLDTMVSCRQDDVVLGADTVLCVQDKVRGKPTSAKDAAALLMEMSGGTAIAWSGVAAFSPENERGIVLVERAEISFNDFTPEIADWYVGTGEPLTRAGALGVSLLGEVFVNEIRGSHSCVAGLPKRATLLACSDPALGRYRIQLSKSIREMLRWSWLERNRCFDGCGQWV